MIFQQVLLTLHTSKSTFNFSSIMAEYIKQEMSDLHGTGEKKVYYRMKRNLHFTHEQFLEWLENADPFITKHVESVLKHITHQMAVAMALGHSVTIDGRGTFRAGIGLKRGKEMDGLDDGKPSLNAQSLQVTDVYFRPDKKLIRDTNYNCTLTRGATRRIRKQKYTREERLARALEYLDNHATMNIAQYVSLTGLSRTAATLELQAFRNDPESGITYEGSRTHKVYVRRR